MESERGLRGRLARNEDHLGLIAGEVDPEEAAQGFVSHLLGYHVVVAIAHEHNPIANLPLHLLRSAMSGESTTWQHVGGDTRGVLALACVQEDQFTDRGAAFELLGVRPHRDVQRLNGDDAVREFVAANENALGLCSLAAVQRAPAGIRVLPIDGELPSAAAHAARRYLLATPVRVVARDAWRCNWISSSIAEGALTPP